MKMYKSEEKKLLAFCVVYRRWSWKVQLANLKGSD